MEMIELSQKEIQTLIQLLESVDLEELEDLMNVRDLITLHEKLQNSKTY